MFSKAGATVTASRNRLTGKYLKKLIFIRNTTKTDFFVDVLIYFNLYFTKIKSMDMSKYRYFTTDTVSSESIDTLKYPKN